MKKLLSLLRYLVIIAVACFCFIIIDDVYAISNLNGLSDLTLDPFGVFYDNVNGTSRSIGYYMGLVGEDPSDPLAYYVAFPTGSTQYTNGGQGGSIVQCNMSFVQGNYYSVTYYWLSDSNSYYYHPFYSNLSNKLAIGNSISVSYPNFTYESISQSVQTKLVQNIGYVSAYTVIFKAPQTGTCLLSTFSSSPTGPSDGLGFVGYTYRSLGSTAPTSAEIALELNAQFSSIENSLNTGFGAVIGSINSSNTQIGDKVDSSTDEIINNQEQNKQEIIDNANQNHQEAEDTRKGIWASLTDGIANIGNWFSELGSSIGNFFKELGDGIANGFASLFKDIKSLFVGEEVCEVTKENIFTGYDIANIYPDENGYITLNNTTSSGLYIRASKKNLEVGKSYNFFIEIEDYSFKPGTNVWFYPVISSTINYELDPKIAYTHQSSTNEFILQSTGASCSGKVCNKLITVNDNSKYFIETGLQNYVFGSNSMIKYRILITDDLSMTVDNYEYYDKKEECTTKGGLFGMITSFMSNVGKWFSDLLTGLLDGLKALFIPDDEYFSTYFSSLYDFFTEKLGILMYPIDLFINVLTRFTNLSNETTGLIHIPEISIPGFGVLVTERSFYINENWNDGPLLTLYNIYKAFVSCFVGLCLVRLAYKKEKEIVDGSGS